MRCSHGRERFFDKPVVRQQTTCRADLPEGGPPRNRRATATPSRAGHHPPPILHPCHPVPVPPRRGEGPLIYSTKRSRGVGPMRRAAAAVVHPALTWRSHSRHAHRYTLAAPTSGHCVQKHTLSRRGDRTRALRERGARVGRQRSPPGGPRRAPAVNSRWRHSRAEAVRRRALSFPTRGC